MWLLILGLVLFLGVHSVAIIGSGARERAVAQWGEGAWKGIYSLVSLAGFVLICVGYSHARSAPLLYVPSNGLRTLALVVMLPVFPLLLAAYLPGRIQRFVKHPMLLAVILWSGAHLLANGSAADALLFGGFFVWAIADRISMVRRPSKAVGGPLSRWNDAIAVVAGVGAYGVFIVWLHRWLFGVAPLP